MTSPPYLVELAFLWRFSFPRMGGKDVSIRTCRSTALALRLRRIESEKTEFIIANNMAPVKQKTEVLARILEAG